MIQMQGVGAVPMSVGETLNANGVTDQRLGQYVCEYDKESLGSSIPGGSHSGQVNVYRVVLNNSGSTLNPGVPVKYQARYNGIVVDGYGQPGNPEFAGFVPKQYVNGVATGKAFLVLVDGKSAKFGDTTNVNEVDLFDASNFNRLKAFGPIDHMDGNARTEGDWDFSDTGSVTRTQDDVCGGVLKVVNSASDEDEANHQTAGAMFLFQQYRPIVFGARIKAAEANTDDANIHVGLSSAAVTGFMQDAGAGPASSYSGLMFFKVDGGTVWQCESSLAGTQDTDTDCGTRSTTAYQDLLCYWYPTSSTSGTAKFYIDGALVHTSTFTYTNAAQMRFTFGIKNGGANAETLYVDYAFCRQVGQAA